MARERAEVAEVAGKSEWLVNITINITMTSLICEVCQAIKNYCKK